MNKLYRILALLLAALTVLALAGCRGSGTGTPRATVRPGGAGGNTVPARKSTPAPAAILIEVMLSTKMMPVTLTTADCAVFSGFYLYVAGSDMKLTAEFEENGDAGWEFFVLKEKYDGDFRKIPEECSPVLSVSGGSFDVSEGDFIYVHRVESSSTAASSLTTASVTITGTELE